MDPMTLMMLLGQLGGASGGGGGGSQGGGNSGFLSGAAGSLVGGLANGFGSWFASQAQQDAAREAMGVQRDIYQQQRGDQAPYLQAGQSTLADLLRQMQSGAFDVDGSTLANDPGYQFRLAEGQRALERSAAARGGLNSGGTLRSLARYSQGVASDELQNAWTRRQGAFGRLAHVAGMGQNAANNLGQMGGRYADSMGQLYGALGNAQAAGYMGVANAVSGAAGQIGGMGMMAQQGQQIPGQAVVNMGTAVPRPPGVR